jgi:hypothetical protein
VTEKKRKVIIYPTLPIVQIGVAHTARLYGHHRLTWARVRNENRLDRDRTTLRSGDDTSDFLSQLNPSSYLPDLELDL